jgi:hypothetical protein
MPDFEKGDQNGQGETDDYQSVYGRRQRSAECEASRSAIDALPRDQLLPICIDVQAAAAVAYSIALRDAAPERRAEFEKLSNAARSSTPRRSTG